MGGDDEARRSPSRMPPRSDVVAEERQRRMAGQLEHAGAPASLRASAARHTSCSDRWFRDVRPRRGRAKCCSSPCSRPTLPRTVRRLVHVLARSIARGAAIVQTRPESRDTSPSCESSGRDATSPAASERGDAPGGWRAPRGSPARARASRARRRRATDPVVARERCRDSSSARRTPARAGRSTRSVNCRAIAAVSSVLSESTTTISSAQATDRRASPMSAASFFVMIGDRNLRHPGSLSRGRGVSAQASGPRARLYTTGACLIDSHRPPLIEDVCCDSLSAVPARCSKATSGCRRGCTAAAICSARSCFSIRRTPRRSGARSRSASRTLRPTRRPLAGARRHRHRPRSRPRASACARIFAERQDGALTLRRGFMLAASGSRARRRRRADDGRVDARDDPGRSGRRRRRSSARRRSSIAAAGRRRFGVPFHALVAVDAADYQPDACPLCAQGLPVVKPGSRPAGST